MRKKKKKFLHFVLFKTPSLMGVEYEVNCECDDCFDIARCSLATIQGVSLWLSSILGYDSAH